jgi:hypothetical protein
MTRPLIALLLALVLALTSTSVAVAKGSPMAVDRMVICTGLVASVVYTDADGQPTSAPHLCPDCVMHLTFGVLPFADPAAVPIILIARRGAPLSHATLWSRPDATVLARGPPDVI